MNQNPFKEFNFQLKTLFRQLDKTFPSHSIFKVMIASYKILKTMNKKLPQKYFHDWFYVPHGEKARLRDDSVFFREDFKPPPFYGGMVDEMKQLWLVQDESLKNTIWDYICVLIVLNEKCLEYRKAKKMPPIETLTDADFEKEKDNDDDD